MKKKKFFTKKKGFILAFLAPGILVFLIIYAYPLITVFLTSFCRWNVNNISHPEFLGFSHLFDNYKSIFNALYFNQSLTNSLLWVVLSLAIQVPLAVLVALVLSKKPHGWRFARNMYVIPNIISTAAIGLIFLNMYNPTRGLIPAIVHLFNPEASVNILSNPTSAFWGVTFSFILFGGSSMILVLAQIFSISPDLYEVARIDGAKPWQIDLHIVLPLLKPIIGTIAVLATNYSLLLYNEIALITQGNPGGSTYSLSYFIYSQAFGAGKASTLNFALANTTGVIQFLIGLVLVGLLNKSFQTNKSDI